MSKKNEPRFLDVPGVAQYLNISERWVRRAVAERRIPFVKAGALLRFDRVELDEWILGNTFWPERQ